jgi:hypothetical protein
MSRFADFLLLFLMAGDPLREVWIVNPAATGAGPSLAAVLPEVHRIETTDDAVIVRSAGISTHHLGPLQNPPSPLDAVSRFEFRIPRRPQPVGSGADSAWLPQGAIGVFVNGAPIYNQFVSASYQGRNLWHYDLVASAAREPLPPLLRNVIGDAARHSPILGFAFDGYPIYGPWAFANADGTGGLRRMRSSYRLRSVLSSTRCQWPDGTRLTPGQCGPDIDARNPAGTFVEDYAYVPGAGDLDADNGRFTITPDYPQGAYAYFLTTDAQGRLAFPYLLAHRYHGEIDLPAPPPVHQTRGLLTLRTPVVIESGVAATLSFEIGSNRIRHPEQVHEKPLHVLVISEDLHRFDHIHPELTPAGSFDIRYAFQHPGRYRIYADFTPPGAPQQIESFPLVVAGKAPAPDPGKGPTHGLSIQLRPPADRPLRAGEDTTLDFTVRDRATGLPPAGIEPFLGAWAHFVVVDPEHSTFLHAHPLDDSAPAPADGATGGMHIHGVTDAAAAAGPPPPVIRTTLSFPRAGRYKLWAQVQRYGTPVTEAFWLDIAPPAAKQTISRAPIPPGATRLLVNKDGFHPAEIAAIAGKPLLLAVERDPGPNCGGRIVFPTLNRTVEIPLGGVTLIELPPLPAGTVRFSCGMGMYRGAIVANSAKSN